MYIALGNSLCVMGMRFILWYFTEPKKVHGGSILVRLHCDDAHKSYSKHDIDVMIDKPSFNALRFGNEKVDSYLFVALKF